MSSKIKENNPAVIELLKKSLIPLSSHIAIIQTVINHDAIIIDGGPSALGQPIIDIISNNLKTMQLPFIQKSTMLLTTSTKNNAGIYGATIYAKKTKDKKSFVL